MTETSDRFNVEELRRVIEARLGDLQPALEEFDRLRAILELIDEGEEIVCPDLPLDARSKLPSVHEPDSGLPFMRPLRLGSGPGRDGRAPSGFNKKRILQAVLRHPGIHSGRIAEITGIKRQVAASTVNRLKRNGELEVWGDGVRIPVTSLVRSEDESGT